jgi:TolA-binding protein
MDEKKNWWQTMPTKKLALMFAGVTAFALIVFVGWKAFSTPDERDSFALIEQEQKIRDMEDRLAKLQRELEESSRQLRSLQSGSDENTRPRRPTERRVSSPRREEPRPVDPNRSKEPRLYETVRDATVFEEPDSYSRKVGTIPNGSRVRVVGAAGDWLEVRSRQGRPPGFIRRDDAVVSR